MRFPLRVTLTAYGRQLARESGRQLARAEGYRERWFQVHRRWCETYFWPSGAAVLETLRIGANHAHDLHRWFRHQAKGQTHLELVNPFSRATAL